MKIPIRWLMMALCNLALMIFVPGFVAFSIGLTVCLICAMVSVIGALENYRSHDPRLTAKRRAKLDWDFIMGPELPAPSPVVDWDKFDKELDWVLQLASDVYSVRGADVLKLVEVAEANRNRTPSTTSFRSGPSEIILRHDHHGKCVETVRVERNGSETLLSARELLDLSGANDAYEAYIHGIREAVMNRMITISEARRLLDRRPLDRDVDIDRRLEEDLDAQRFY